MLPNVTWNGLPKTSNLKQRWLISHQNNGEISGARGKNIIIYRSQKMAASYKKMAQVRITSGYVVTLLLLPVATWVARSVRSMINAFRTTDARHSINSKRRKNEWLFLKVPQLLEDCLCSARHATHPHCLAFKTLSLETLCETRGFHPFFRGVF